MMASSTELMGSQVVSQHSTLADAMISKGNNSGTRGEAPQRYPDHRTWKEEWQGGKSTGSGVRSGLISVAPSVIICVASDTQYLLSLTFYISKEEDHIACLAGLQLLVYINAWHRIHVEKLCYTALKTLRSESPRHKHQLIMPASFSRSQFPPLWHGVSVLCGCSED